MERIEVLLVEDNLPYADLIATTLSRISRSGAVRFELERVEKRSEAEQRAADARYGNKVHKKRYASSPLPMETPASGLFLYSGYATARKNRL